MAGLMYPTGVSSIPIDFASAAANYAQTAVETKLQEIKEKKAVVDKNTERALKAISISVIPELSGKARDDYQKQLEEYRAGVINRMKQSRGELSLEDQKFIEQGYFDLTNKMNMEKVEMQKFDEFRKSLLDPRFDKSMDKATASRLAAEYRENKLAGKPTMPVEEMFVRSRRVPTSAEFAMDVSDKIIEQISRNNEVIVNGVVYTTASVRDPQTLGILADQLLQSWEGRGAFTNPDGTVDPVKYQKERADFIKVLENRISESEVKYPPSRGGGGSGPSTAFSFPTKEMTLGKKTYSNYFATPTSIPQTERIVALSRAYSLETGKEEDTGGDVEIMGVDFDADAIILQGVGSVLKKGGETAYASTYGSGSSAASQTDKANKLKYSVAESKIKDKATQEGALRAALREQNPNEAADQFIVDSLTPTENGYVLRGRAIKKGRGGVWGIGKKEAQEIPLEVEYTMLRDESGTAPYEIPLRENSQLLGNWIGKGIRVYGTPVEELLKSAPPKKPTPKQGNNDPLGIF